MKTKMPEMLSFISEEAVSRKMTSEEIAAHFGYDKHHFSRKFKEINGFSVVEFLSSLKVEKAIIELNEESVFSTYKNIQVLKAVVVSRILLKNIQVVLLENTKRK